VPAVRGIQFLFNNPLVEKQQARVYAISAAVLLTFAILFFLVPFPLYTRAEGVMWLPEKSQIRVETEGFVSQLLAEQDSQVSPGTALLSTQDPLLTSEIKVSTYRLQELEAKYYQKLHNEYPKAQMIKEEIAAARAELQRLQEKVANQIVRSSEEGLFVVPKADDLLDKWVKHGELVGYVVKYPLTTVRAVVSQDRIGLLQQHIETVELRLVEDTEQVYQGKVERAVPAASNQLPSAALGQAGGGEIAVDPTDKEGGKAFETVFQYDIQLLEPPSLHHLGSRVYLRFSHGHETLALQCYRLARQLFLRKFGI